MALVMDEESVRQHSQQELITAFMQITSVIQMLTPANLGQPVLRALIPNKDNYSALLMQPEGQIDASPAGVRHQNGDLAQKQFRAFLEHARTANADLVVTPEYSMPWVTLIEEIKAGHTPNQGALWALGSESIRYGDLAALQQHLAPYAEVLYEPLQPDPQRFVDPLVYVFVAPPANGNDPGRTVLLVQFKTCPMGDVDHFENNNMQRGTQIYEFGAIPNDIRLVSLICSDALEFMDHHAVAVYERTLILHIQLNQKPRHDQFRQCRAKLLAYKGGTTEIICLNWAKNVYVTYAGKERCWDNISGSAWYLCPDEFDDRDVTQISNHKRGFYYTWSPSLHSHALFFNYQAASYLLTATKVVHHGVPPVLSRRRGPQLNGMRVWHAATSAWVDNPTTEDGFSSAVIECRNAQHEIKNLADINPFIAERILALCAGKIGDNIQWYTLRHLDSCTIEATEVIRRITFCQDTDNAARDFRIARLRRCARLWDILTTPTNLPAVLSDISAGFHFEWVVSSPHQNVISTQGRRATVIYMGDANDAQLEAVKKHVADFLHKASACPNTSVENRQRLHVWHLDSAGKPALYKPTQYLKYNDPRSTSEFDIARDT